MVSHQDEGKVWPPEILNRAAKIVIAKSLEKRKHSTGKIPKSLAEKGYSASSSTVYRDLTQNIGARAFKRPKIPRITKRIKASRLYSLVITRIGPLKIGGRFFGQMNLHLTYFQHQTDRTIEYGVRMATISLQFSK